MNDFTAVVEIVATPQPLIRRFSIPASLADLQNQSQRHMMIALMALCQQAGGEVRIHQDTFMLMSETSKLLCVDDRKTGDLILRLVK